MLCRQMHSDEGTARDWLASMMELVAGMGSVAASAVLTPRPGRFSPLQSFVMAQKDLQEQAVKAIITKLLAAAAAGSDGAEALWALLPAATGIGGGKGSSDNSSADISGLLALAAAGANGNPNVCQDWDLSTLQDTGAAFQAPLAPKPLLAVTPPATALMPAPTSGGFDDDDDDRQLGEALQSQYIQNLQGTRIFPDNGTAWAGMMGVASTRLPPGCAAETEGPGTETEGSRTGLMRVLGLVPHLASRAMGIVWEQEAEDDGELSWEDGVPPQVRGGFFPGDSCFTISHIIPIFPFNGPSQSISTSDLDQLCKPSCHIFTDFPFIFPEHTTPGVRCSVAEWSHALQADAQR